MPNFLEISQKFVIDSNLVLSRVFKQKKIQKAIIETIQNRLFQKGVTGTGAVLQTNKGRKRGSPYAALTEQLKTEGVLLENSNRIVIGRQPTNRVTLFSKGELYNSMMVQIEKTQIEMVANFSNPKYFESSPLGIYKNFTDMFNGKEKFEESVMSLSPKEKNGILLYIENELLNEYRKEINK